MSSRDALHVWNGRVSTTIVAVIAGATILGTTACNLIYATQPSNGVADSSAVAAVDISFGRNIGDGLAVLDTVTLVATVRDYRGKVTDDALVSWGLKSSFDRLAYEPYTGGSIVKTEPHRALLTITGDVLTVLASARNQANRVAIDATLDVNASRR